MNSIDLKYYIVIGLLKTVALLPLSILYLFSDFACFVLHKLVKYRVKVVRKNLRNSFPEKSEKELRKIENKFYQHLCDCFIEAIKLLHISDRQLKKRVQVDGLEILTENAERKQSTIFYLGHYGNWEWVPAITLWFEGDSVLGDLYKPLHNKLMNRVTGRLRSRFSSITIPVRTAYRKLLQLQREVNSVVIGFIADQRPVGQPLNHWLEFLNQPTAVMVGGETIGDRIKADYVYACMQKVKRGHYLLKIQRMEKDKYDDKPYPYTRMFYSMLAESIRNAPPYWLWSHNRWKSTPPADCTFISQ